MVNILKRLALALPLLICALAAIAARAESANAYSMSCVYLENEQALSVSMTLEYTNTSGTLLESVPFNVYANCFRRELTLPYDNATLEAAFPNGYAPSGIEFTRVCFNGEPARLYFEGASECFLWVRCALEPAATGVFSFEYTLLLSDNRAFQGCGEDVRLCLFYPSPCVWHDGFVLNSPCPAAYWLESEPSDFECDLYLPSHYALAGGVSVTTRSAGNGYSCHHISQSAATELALCFSPRYYTRSANAESGASIRCLGSNRGENRRALSEALRAAEVYERWFGPLPYARIDIVHASCAVSGAHPGLIILGRDARDDETAAIRALLAKEYFVCALGTNPNIDPFLSDGLSLYVSMLLEEEFGGEAALRKLLSQQVLPALKLTVPGGLTPDSYLNRFSTIYEYNLVAVRRGAAVMHEMRLLTGREVFLAALEEYYTNGRGHVRGIQDFVSALDTASGRELGSALVSWLYTIDEYSSYQWDEYY